MGGTRTLRRDRVGGRASRTPRSEEEHIVGKLDRQVESVDDFVREERQRNGTVKQEPGTVKCDPAGTRATYEVEWLSDPEFDDQQLQEIIQEGVSTSFFPDVSSQVH